MCRCAERRVALGAAVSSLALGDLVAAKARMGVVAQSVVADARDVAKSVAKSVAKRAAHARLAGR